LLYNKLKGDNPWLMFTKKWFHQSTLCILGYNALDKRFLICPNKPYNISMLHSYKHHYFFGKCWFNHHCFLYVLLSFQDFHNHFVSIVDSLISIVISCPMFLESPQWVKPINHHYQLFGINCRALKEDKNNISCWP
jgi:hypothetical protein